MKKLLILLLIVLISPIIGGGYGILHDQLTYTISHEYYTKFKFHQFGLMLFENEAVNPRILVSIVGFMATWWMGLPIGFILGLVGLRHQNHKRMFVVTMKAVIITIIVTFITGLVGLTYGKLYLVRTGVSWYLPDNLIDIDNFISVGSMHNFSYLGGLLGLIAGIIYSVKQRRKTRLLNG